MLSVQYKAKSGKTQFKSTLAHLEEILEADQGFCLACGETQDGVEPDARRYECECCGEERVYGAAELALMGVGGMNNITSSGFDGIYALYNKENQPVKVGVVLTDFRGNIHTVKSGTAPQHENSTGRIYTNKGSFFPSVFDCKFVNIHPDSVVSPVQTN